MRHALFLLALAIASVVGWGIAFAAVEHVSTGTGLYWALTTATTVGYGDVTPHAVAGHLLAAGAMVTTIPLLASCFGLATSWHVRRHIRHQPARPQSDADDIKLALAGIKNILLKLEAGEPDGD